MLSPIQTYKQLHNKPLAFLYVDVETGIKFQKAYNADVEVNPLVEAIIETIDSMDLTFERIVKTMEMHFSEASRMSTIATMSTDDKVIKFHSYRSSVHYRVASSIQAFIKRKQKKYNYDLVAVAHIITEEV